jgi:hypothetical protein
MKRTPPAWSPTLGGIRVRHSSVQKATTGNILFGRPDVEPRGSADGPTARGTQGRPGRPLRGTVAREGGRSSQADRFPRLRASKTGVDRPGGRSPHHEGRGQARPREWGMAGPGRSSFPSEGAVTDRLPQQRTVKPRHRLLENAASGARRGSVAASAASPECLGAPKVVVADQDDLDLEKLVRGSDELGRVCGSSIRPCPGPLFSPARLASLPDCVARAASPIMRACGPADKGLGHVRV